MTSLGWSLNTGYTVAPMAKSFPYRVENHVGGEDKRLNTSIFSFFHIYFERLPESLKPGDFSVKD